MWKEIVDAIVKFRFFILLTLLAISIFMGYKALDVKLSHEFPEMLPKNDSTSIAYKNFKKNFGQDGMVMYVCVADDNILKLDNFNAWYDVAIEISKIKGLNNVLSVSNIYDLKKDNIQKQFTVGHVFLQKPETQEELDSLLLRVFDLKFYEGLLFDKEASSFVMALTTDIDIINSKKRHHFISEIQSHFNTFEEKTNIKVHYSGLPYIRTITSKKIETELILFILLALIVAAIALFLFFRSFKAVFFPLLIVVIGVIWVLGLISLLGYEITILSGIIPSLLIVIGVENCIYLLNKYHKEYILLGDKRKTLILLVEKIGKALFMTNLTTAIGFSAFIITGNQMLIEFGIVAFISILMGFLLSIILIPIFFSYLKAPTTKNLKHLENKYIKTVLDLVILTVMKSRKTVYIFALFFLVLGIAGVFMLKTSGRVVDDIPQKESMYKDLLFFEKTYKGIMPLEISIDTKKKKGLISLENIKKIDSLQMILHTYKELSRSMSIVDLIKFSSQAYYNGNVEWYKVPSKRDWPFIYRYVPEFKNASNNLMRNFTDSTYQIARVNVQMANVTTKEIIKISNELKPQIDRIFPRDKYDVVMTGSSMVFLKGTNFLVKNLIVSLVCAILLIALLMAFLFRSSRMIIVTMVSNLFPQILTAAMMGYFGIPIKPSTILIFSIAFGISVDNSIHFLAKYRLELKQNASTKESIVLALRETGVSMIYSAIVLFFGFAIFIASTFGGTKALGFLISFTLLVALLSNLLIMPSILLSWQNWEATKKYKKNKVKTCIK